MKGAEPGKNEKRALITGVTGQDGSFLAELLLEKGYEVWGMIRRSSTGRYERIEHLAGNSRFHIRYGDMIDAVSLVRLAADLRPDEIYNLAAQSDVAISFEIPDYTAQADALGTLYLLEAVRAAGLEKSCRVYQASTSELFGGSAGIPLGEDTPFHPRSPYAAAKQYAFSICRSYREAYGMFISNGILFNHESERRGENFVTRKITLAAARIAHGLQDRLHLGNLGAKRDWGFAGDYVECMWRMLRYTRPDDFVIATGRQHSVREFCSLAFSCAGTELAWRGEGPDEQGVDKRTGRVLVDISPELFRPADVESLLGNPEKAAALLGWTPEKTSFETLVRRMVDFDMKYVLK